MSLEETIASLESYIADPKKGLPEEVFLLVSRLTPLVNVDLLIQNEKKETLMTWRSDGFGPSGWHLPGGIIRFKETLDYRLRAVAQKELGVEIEFDPVPLCMNESHVPTRENRSHFISFLYRCRLLRVPAESLRYQGGALVPGVWAWHLNCPENLLPVHRRLYKDFIEGAHGNA